MTEVVSAMEPTASRSARPELAPDVEALAALLDCEADLEALERALLAAALHPAGRLRYRMRAAPSRRRAAPRHAGFGLAHCAAEPAGASRARRGGERRARRAGARRGGAAQGTARRRAGRVRTCGGARWQSGRD